MKRTERRQTKPKYAPPKWYNWIVEKIRAIYHWIIGNKPYVYNPISHKVEYISKKEWEILEKELKDIESE